MSTDVTRRTVLAGTGAAAVLSATGVSIADQHEDDEEEDTDESEDDGEAEFAAVNAVHASPDAPNVDVFVNGARVLEDVAFRHFSDYLALLQGEYTVQIVPVGGADGAGNGNGMGNGDGTGNGAGSGNGTGNGDGTGDGNGTGNGSDDGGGVGSDDGGGNGTGTGDDGNGMDSGNGAGGDTDPTEDAVIDEDIEVPAGVVTAAVIGEAAEDADQELELSVQKADLSELADGESRVRAVHASPDAPEVDIVADDNPLVEGLTFGNSETFDVAEGEYTLEVREAGQDESVADFDVTLDAGVVYSAFAVGFLEEQGGDSGGMDDSGDNGSDSAGAGDSGDNSTDSGDNGSDSGGMGDSEDNGSDSAGAGDSDTGFDLLMNVDALTPSADVEETAGDDGGMGGDDENGGMGGDDENGGMGGDDEDGADDDSSSI